MATKQIRKTKPKTTQNKETKIKTKAQHKNSKSAAAVTKTKTKPKADAPATAKPRAKATSSARRAPAELSTNAKGSRRSPEPDARTKTPISQSAGRAQTKSRKPDANGHVDRRPKTAKHAEPVNGMAPEATTNTSPATVGKTARSPQAEQVFLNLFEALEGHAKSQNLGHVVKDAQFDWGEIENPDLHPDLAFVSFERWAAYRHVPKDLTWHVVPDLVVEVVRGSEQTEPISSWLEHYFHAGVNRVWVVYPDQLKIHDHESLSSSRVLDRNQALEGGAILPGFQMPLKALLAEHKM